MTDAHLPDATRAADDPDAVSANPVNPYVTLTALPTSTRVGTSSPNPYVTSTTIVPTSAPDLRPTPVPHSAPSVTAEPDAEPDTEQGSAPVEDVALPPAPVVAPAPPAPTPANAPAAPAHPAAPERPGVNAVGAFALVVAIIAAFSLLDDSGTSRGLALLMSVVALILGGIAILRRRESRRAAIIALLTSAVVLVISIVSLSQPSTPIAAGDDDIYGHPDSTRDGTGLGSYREPHPMGSAFVVEDRAGQRWAVTVVGWQSDVSSLVRDIDRRNSAPGWAQFASVDVTYANLGTDPEGAWWSDVFVDLAASDGKAYAENRVAGVDQTGIFGALLMPGEPVTVTSYFLLPSNAITGSLLRLDTGDTAVYAALE